ncbi:hypothetical protein BC826DRAFT_1015040 [Russula brevipes]|nr:hypothetical protein BC826DRAFT_1015040 [Russula brevipes]
MPPARNKRKRRSASHPYAEPTDNKKIVVQPLGVETPLEGFFSRYSEFQFQPLNSPVAEFKRLCKEYHWKKDDPEKEAARDGFNTAIKREFNDLYGSDENDINNWQKLCRVLRIDPVPDTLGRCRAVVFTKHVNLVDLVEGNRKEVRIFKTEEQLSQYTRETRKFFPKENAKDGGVLRALRRHILSPGAGAGRLRTAGKRGRRNKEN